MRRFIPLLVSVLALLALALIVARSVERGTSHDEHQFLVPGLLTFREGLLPYRDYPLFHVPYQILLHGALGVWTGHTLLSARLVCAVAAWLTVVLLALHAARRAGSPGAANWLIGVASGALILFQPVVSYTLLYAWNHTLPTLLVVTAFLCHVRAARADRAAGWLIASGLCVALAGGMRISWMPMLAPFGLGAIFLPGRAGRERLLNAVWFSCGALVALAPLIWLWALAPEAATFGNFGYPKLSLLWRKYPMWHEDLARFVDPVRGFLNPLGEEIEGRDLEKKLERFAELTLRENWTFFVAIVPLIIGGVVGAVWARTWPWSWRFAWLVLPFVVWGALAPSRIHAQYHYPLLPFLLLLAAESWQLLSAIPGMRRGLSILAAACTVLAVGLHSGEYASVRQLASPSRWGVFVMRKLSESVRNEVPHGRVLTLNALAAAETGVPIYLEFSSGEFPWRVAHLLPKDKRERLHLVSVFELEEFLAADPPAAILVDEDERLDAPLLAYAKAHGYARGPKYLEWELWIDRPQ